MSVVHPVSQLPTILNSQIHPLGQLLLLDYADCLVVCTLQTIERITTEPNFHHQDIEKNIPVCKESCELRRYSSRPQLSFRGNHSENKMEVEDPGQKKFPSQPRREWRSKIAL
jgi:hypothetical protein